MRVIPILRFDALPGAASRLAIAALLLLAPLAAQSAETKTTVSITGIEMATERVGNSMGASKLVLDLTLPNEPLLVMPFVVDKLGTGMALQAKFNGVALTSFTATDFALEESNLYHVDITNVTGRSGKLEISLSSTTPASIVIVQDVREPDGWPWHYNGTVPDPALNLGVNNIATYDAATQRLYSCVKFQTNGQASSYQGIERFDMAFEVNMAQATVKVINTRPFNPTQAKTLAGMQPDCTGVYETTTQRYTDTIEVGTDTYRVSFNLFDGTALQLRIVEAVKL